LRLAQDFKNQEKDFSTENWKENLELNRYNAGVENHIFWGNRYQVASLMENFLNKKIDGEEFCDAVQGLRHKLINTCDKFLLELISSSEKIKNFQPDERSEKLRRFLTGLFCECEHFDEDYETEEFYISIENGFLNFQKALNEE